MILIVSKRKNYLNCKKKSKKVVRFSLPDKGGLKMTELRDEKAKKGRQILGAGQWGPEKIFCPGPPESSGRPCTGVRVYSLGDIVMSV